MFVFHNTFDVAGAGPAENREKAESPWNCGHSYWFKLPSDAVVALTCALVGLTCGERDAKTAEQTSSRTKIAPTLRFFIIGGSPKSY